MLKNMKSDRTVAGASYLINDVLPRAWNIEGLQFRVKSLSHAPDMTAHDFIVLQPLLAQLGIVENGGHNPAAVRRARGKLGSDEADDVRPEGRFRRLVSCKH